MTSSSTSIAPRRKLIIVFISGLLVFEMLYVGTQTDVLNNNSNPFNSIEWKQFDFWGDSPSSHSHSDSDSRASGGRKDVLPESDDDVEDANSSRFRSALKNVHFAAEAKQTLFNMYPEDYNDVIEKERLEKAILNAY